MDRISRLESDTRDTCTRRDQSRDSDDEDNIENKKYINCVFYKCRFCSQWPQLFDCVKDCLDDCRNIKITIVKWSVPGDGDPGESDHDQLCSSLRLTTDDDHDSVSARLSPLITLITGVTSNISQTIIFSPVFRWLHVHTVNNKFSTQTGLREDDLIFNICENF